MNKYSTEERECVDNCADKNMHENNGICVS